MNPSSSPETCDRRVFISRASLLMLTFGNDPLATVRFWTQHTSTPADSPMALPISKYSRIIPEMPKVQDDPIWEEAREYSLLISTRLREAGPEEAIDSWKKQDGATYDPLADTLEKDAKQRFIKADDAYFAATSRRIDINEGSTDEGNARRSCRRQSQLWLSRNVLQMPGAAKAALPGCSLHNHGLGIDVKGVNDTMRQVLHDAGWMDDVEGEAWHFSCLQSSAYDKVRKKIAELREGLAAQWAADSVKGFGLTQSKNRLYKELQIRRVKFEGDVQGFNQHAKVFNDSLLAFQQQTDAFPRQRDELLTLVHGTDEKFLKLETAYAEFRVASDRVIQALEADLEEIRRLIALPPEDADAEIKPRLAGVPAALRAEYVRARDRYQQLAGELRSQMEVLQRMTSGFQGSLNSFEQRALAMLEQHRFLTKLRKDLEAERNSIERGFVDVQLMGRESMFRLGRAGTTLEEIQRQVDLVSPS